MKPAFPSLSSQKQCKELDVKASQQGLTINDLMEQAGILSAEQAVALYPKSSFVLLCGPGNNGGDAWVMARHLKKLNHSVQVFASDPLSEFLKTKKQETLQKGVISKSLKEMTLEDLKGKVIVDGLFGVGLSRNLDGVFEKAISLVNASSSAVISLDVPSGLEVDTGNVLGSSVQAHHTFTFGLSKLGFYLNEGPQCVGKIHVLSIGFSEKLLNEVCNQYFLVEKESLVSFLPTYKQDAHKSQRGHTLICAGRKGFWGSGVLACRGAFVVGSGYVTWASLQDVPDILPLPEVLTSTLEDEEILLKKTAVALGPGVGLSDALKKFLQKLIKTNLAVVLDADALTFLSKQKEVLNQNFVLTPHSGELSRLLNLSSDEINRHRLRSVEQGAQLFQSWMILKGFHSILSNGQKSWIINSGNSALGKAGTGDVLTGMIAGFLAQGLDVKTASLLGVCIHGEVAEEWCRRGKDINSCSASEVLNLIPEVICEMKKYGTKHQ